MTTAQDKFQQLLRELFQFDCADLDFGIYRIMNHKRDVIEKFISKDLPKDIAKELDRGALAEQSQAAQEFKDVAEQLRGLDKNAIDADGALQMFTDTDIGRKYEALKEKVSGGRGREALEATIFNHLYAFFSRYYQDGDFISKRRYSKRQKYAIPYNGEEVYLHWANHDQYYVKTAEHFHDYTFTSRGVTVHFKLTAANVEQNNVKGDKRFFVPHAKEIDWNEKADELVIPFEYRPLTDQEKIAYGTKNQQDKIIADAVESVPDQLSPKKHGEALAAISAERHKNSDGQSVSFLEHHLRQYTRKNTSDFFIHKNLKGFLSRELDFYLKNEVLNLDEMEAAGEDRSDGWFQVLRVIKTVGSRIIDFLDQIESFQKMLWEKRKFVTETQYCITVGTIDESFYPDIAACDAQWAEWKELFHIDEEQSDLFSHGKSKKDRRIAFLKAYPTLVIDTNHLGTDVVDKMVGSMGNLDAATDGVLVHSENYQAIRLLVEKYRERIQSVYIDPPYNTGPTEILYKNEYKDSSWMSLMADRLLASLRLLESDGCYAIAIDDYEMAHLCEAVDQLLGQFDRHMVVVNHHPQGGMSGNLTRTHEYMLMLTPVGLDILQGKEKSGDKEYRSFMLSGPGSNKSRFGRPNSFFAILVDEQRNAIVGLEPPPAPTESYPTSRTKEGYVRRYPISPSGEEKVWCRSYDSALAALKNNEIVLTTSGTLKLVVDTRNKRHSLMSNWTDSRYNAGPHGTALVADIIGHRDAFSYPKSIYTVKDAIEAMVYHYESPLILDYFAGSGTTGHAIIELNREDSGHRQFIMAEMGQYFDSVLLPRIKKVTFAPEWKNGKPKRMATADEADRSPRIIKYLRLESYEDALNNIAFADASDQGMLRFDDYLIKYMLKWETRKSETLLNVKQLAKPFSYKLTVAKGDDTIEKVVDLPETFNYLLGLHVITRKVYDDDGRRYLVYHGRIDHRRIAVIWRETEGWQKKNLERDKKFVAEQKLAEGADEVFVNGDSFIPNAKALEPVFKARMFSTVEA